jgi:hypothetical protein
VNRPRVLAVLALSAAFLGSILAVVWLSSSSNSSDDGTRAVSISDPLAEALRYVPRSAPAVAVVDTDTTEGPLRRALDLLARLPGATEISGQLDKLVTGRTGLSLTDDLGALAGAPLVLASTGTSARPAGLAAWVVPDESTLAQVLSARVADGLLEDDGASRRATLYARVSGRGVFAQDGRLLLAATDRTTLDAALSRGVRRGESAARGLTRAAFATNAASGISASQAVLRVAVTGDELRRLAATRLSGAGELPWLAGVLGAGIGVRADEDGLHARIRIHSDESAVAESDLPIAAGPQPPEVNGDGAVRVGLRSPAQTAGFALRSLRLIAPGRLQAYDEIIDALGQYTRVDPENDIVATLTGPATFTFPDLTAVTLRAQTSDEDGVREALGKIARVGSLANLGGGFGLDVTGLAIQDEGDDTYKLTRDDEPIAVIALRGDILVASTDPLTDVDEVADALDDGPADGGVKGALRADASADALGDLLVDRLGLPDTARDLLGGFGATTVTARAELGALTVAVDVGVAG